MFEIELKDFELGERLFDEITLSVEYDYEEGEQQTMWYPGSAESATVFKITADIDNREVDITSELSPGFLEFLEYRAIEDFHNSVYAGRERDYESKTRGW